MNKFKFTDTELMYLTRLISYDVQSSTDRINTRSNQSDYYSFYNKLGIYLLAYLKGDKSKIKKYRMEVNENEF